MFSERPFFEIFALYFFTALLSITQPGEDKCGPLLFGQTTGPFPELVNLG